MERREFIAGCSALVAAGAASSQVLPSLMGAAAPSALALDRAFFERRIGSQFRAYGSDGRFLEKLRLLAVQDGPSAAGLEQFTVVWEARYAEVMPPGIYRMTNGSDATLDLALDSAAGAGRRPRYRATFSLLAPDAA